jgi:hypothetical protein
LQLDCQSRQAEKQSQIAAIPIAIVITRQSFSRIFVALEITSTKPHSSITEPSGTTEHHVGRTHDQLKPCLVLMTMTLHGIADRCKRYKGSVTPVV